MRFTRPGFPSPAGLGPVWISPQHQLFTWGRRGGGQKGGQDTTTRQPRPRREETWNAVVQSLPHRTLGTNSQGKEQKITLRLADGDRRGSVQLWRRGCAVDQTHTRLLLSRHPLGLVPRPRSRRASLAVSVWSRFLVGRDRPSRIQKTRRADSLLVRITSRSALSSCCLRSSSPLPGRRRYHVALAGRGPADSWKATGGWDSVFPSPPLWSISPPLWSINNRLSSIDERFPTPVVPRRRRRRFLSLPRPLLPVVALLERSVAPPPPLTCAAASSSSTQKQKQKQHVCQRGRRESGRLRRASLPATLLYGRSHVSVSPGVQGELSYPTHASRGGRATRRCERTVQWGEEEEEPARTHCSLLAASLRPGRVGLLPVAVCSSLMGKT